MVNWKRQSPRRRLGSACVLAAALFSGTAHAQWSPNNPIENAPAKDKIPAYVQHATYTASKAPVPGPVEVGYNYHLPPGYDADVNARYPVIFQLGGHTDNESIGLVDRGLPNRYQEKMADGTLRPVISVYVNGPGTLESYVQLQATLIEELLPHIDGKFRTLATAPCRHIEGYSRGGSGAPLFAFRYPQLFSAAGSNAGSATEGIKDVLPGLKAGALAAGVRLRVTILEGDHLFDANVMFRAFLDEQAIPYDFSSAPGGAHDTNKYFNDPATYDQIGYGNIVWHEKAFKEQGCGIPDAPIGGGGAGGGGGSGTSGSGGTSAMLGGAAGSPATVSGGANLGGASAAGGRAEAGAAATPAGNASAADASGCSLGPSDVPSKPGAWLCLGLALAAWVRRKRA